MTKPLRIKIKDLPDGQPLEGVRFIYPVDNQPYYWISQWGKGVWGKKNMDDTRVYPLFVDDIKDALEWEVLP